MRVRRLVPVLVAVVSLLLLGRVAAGQASIFDDPGSWVGTGGAPGPAMSPVRTVPVGSEPVAVETPGYWSWAALDRATGQLAGGPDPVGTNTTESMIKAWIVADHLRLHTERGARPPARILRLARAAIRHSDDHAAQTLYAEAGGDASIARLIDLCGVTGTTIHAGWWSRTEMTAGDAVRMGLCLADGRAAGAEWTDWVLAEMRQVRGTIDPVDQPHGGRWGIIDALPAELADRVAIKNGWTPIGADRSWHVNCLAIAVDWILAVQARYPVDLGLAHGAGICRDVATQVLNRFGISTARHHPR